MLDLRSVCCLVLFLRDFWLGLVSSVEVSGGLAAMQEGVEAEVEEE